MSNRFDFASPILNTPDFLKGGGEMGALMRAHAWSTSSLGPPATWPQALRTGVRLMLNTGHPMYIWWGPDRACLYNDAYRRSIGPERHPGSLGRPAREVWAEIWDIIGPQIEHVMGGHGATWHENHLVPITRNGKREDVYWTYSYGPIDDDTAPDGVGGVLVVCTETTEQVLSLQRSAEELSRFAALFEQAPSFMAMLQGPEHRIERANPGYMRLIGHRPVLGRTVAEALPEAAEQGYVELLDRVYRSGEAYVARSAKYAVQATPGGPTDDRYLDFVYQPIRNAAGAVTGIFVEGVDVTDRTSADITAQRLASIVESSDDAIISKDLNGTILSWNAGAERLFGYTADEVIGRSITILIPPDLMDEEPRILARVASGERIAHFETMRQRKDRTIIPISLTISPIRDSSGTIIGASKVARDITESRAARERQALLFREINHRVKNLFAVTGGVVSVSARTANSVKELAKLVQSRLAALARAHDLTLPGDLDGGTARKASLSELVRTILSPYDNRTGHITIAGPDVECGPRASTSVALLLHEFATNSVKYGALSGTAGQIDVQWETKDVLALAWTESGGPSIAPPKDDQQGFGGVLVAATVSGFGGTITRDWHESGLTIRVTIPHDQVSL
jgi:PAS domain S-box-containing protein